MDFLKSHVFISFLISCIYFIVKSLIYKIQKDNTNDNRKTLFKDSVIIFIISYLTFIFRDQLVNFQETKTQVFTNQPSF